MTQLSDNPTNTKLMYVYVKNFNWNDSYEIERLEGHPMTGKVYRAAYNKDTKTYRIYYKSVITKKPTCIVIPSLSSVEGGYTSEIVKLTPQSIMKLDLTFDDLKQIISWDSKQNKDLKQSIGFEESNKSESLSTLPVVSEQNFTDAVDEAKEFMEFMECAAKLIKLYPMMFDAIHEVIHYINDFNEDQSTDSISISYSKHGAGYNVGKALDALAIYMSDDRRKNFNENDLLNAIYNLLNEHARISGETE